MSIHIVVCHLQSYRLRPLHSRLCSQMPNPPYSLHLILWRLYGHFAHFFFTDSSLPLRFPYYCPLLLHAASFGPCCLPPGRGTLSLPCALTLSFQGFLFKASRLRGPAHLLHRRDPYQSFAPASHESRNRRFSSDTSPTFSFPYPTLPSS